MTTTMIEALRPLTSEEMVEFEEEVQAKVDKFLIEWENRPRPFMYPTWIPLCGARF